MFITRYDSLARIGNMLALEFNFDLGWTRVADWCRGEPLICQERIGKRFLGVLLGGTGGWDRIVDCGEIVECGTGVRSELPG